MSTKNEFCNKCGGTGFNKKELCDCNDINNKNSRTTIDNILSKITPEQQKRTEQLMILEIEFYEAFVGKDEIEIDPIFKLFAQSAANTAAKICLKHINEKKPHGGKRKGSGRPKLKKSQKKEKTKVIRVPISKIKEVLGWLKQKQL